MSCKEGFCVIIVPLKLKFLFQILKFLLIKFGFLFLCLRLTFVSLCEWFFDFWFFMYVYDLCANVITSFDMLLIFYNKQLMCIEFMHHRHIHTYTHTHTHLNMLSNGWTYKDKSSYYTFLLSACYKLLNLTWLLSTNLAEF